MTLRHPNLHCKFFQNLIFFSFSGSTWKAIIRCHTNFKPSRSTKNRFTKIKSQAKESQRGGWNGRISSMGILINIHISGLSGHFISGTLSNITSGVINSSWSSYFLGVVHIYMDKNLGFSTSSHPLST